MQEQIRDPVFAGYLYPKEKTELKEIIKTYVQSARIDDLESHNDLKSLIVPADGYHFAGNTMAYAYKHAYNSKNVRKVYIVAPLTSNGIMGCVLSTSSIYRCPLGDIRVSLEGNC